MNLLLLLFVMVLMVSLAADRMKRKAMSIGPRERFIMVY